MLILSQQVGEQHRLAPSSGCVFQAVRQSPRAEGLGVAAHEGCFVREPDEASVGSICLLFGVYLCFPTGIKLNNSCWQECILIPQRVNPSLVAMGGVSLICLSLCPLGASHSRLLASIAPLTFLVSFHTVTTRGLEALPV